MRGALRLSTRPLAEVAHTTTAGSTRDVYSPSTGERLATLSIRRSHEGPGVRVHKGASLDSDVLTARPHLDPGARLHVFQTATVPDEKGRAKGCRRGLVVLEGESMPLGWVTIAANGERLVRPVYEHVFTVTLPATVRKRFELTSEVLGRLAVGTHLRVVESRRTNDGAQRVRVVLRGESRPCGWLTSRRPRAAHESTDKVFIREVPPSGAPPLEPDGSTMGAYIQGSRPPTRAPSPENDHMSHLIRFASSSIPMASARSSPGEKRRGADKAGGRGRTPRSASASARAGGRSTARAGGAQTSRSGKVSSSEATTDGGASPPKPTSPSAQRSKSAAKETAPAPIMSSDELGKIHEQFTSLAATKKEFGLALSTRLADALHAKGLSNAQIVKELDINGDGSITKFEFRKTVRAILEKGGKKVDVTQIDALFDSWDKDKGGTLDTDELLFALKKINEVSKNQKQMTAAFEAKKIAQRAIAAEANKALETTIKWEATVAEQKAALDERPVGARLGEWLNSKNLKLADIMSRWDKDGSGTVDREEFIGVFKAIGFKGDVSELQELFRGFDRSGEGNLDKGELRAALHELEESNARLKALVKKLGDASNEKKKIAREAQVEFRRLFEIYNEGEAAEAAAAAVAAAERAAKVAAAKAAKEAAAKEAEAIAAAEKAAFDAKIAAKRAEFLTTVKADAAAEREAVSGVRPESRRLSGEGTDRTTGSNGGPGAAAGTAPNALGAAGAAGAPKPPGAKAGGATGAAAPKPPGAAAGAAAPQVGAAGPKPPGAAAAPKPPAAGAVGAAPKPGAGAGAAPNPPKPPAK